MRNLDKLAQTKEDAQKLMDKLCEDDRQFVIQYAASEKQDVCNFLITGGGLIGVWCLSDNPETIFRLATIFDFILAPQHHKAYTACNAIGWQRLRNPHSYHYHVYCLPEKKQDFRRKMMGLDN